MKSDSVSTQGKWPHLHGFALFAVDGPWSVKVESDGRETILDVEPPDRIAVSAERHDELPVFDATKPAYCRGKALNGVAARGCSVRWALELESVEVRAAADGRVLARDVAWSLQPDWGVIGWAAPERRQDGPVLVSYAYRLRRIDAVVLRADGTIALVKGTPHIGNPAAPACRDGETLLGTIYVDARTDRLSDENLFPLLPPAPQSRPLAFNPPARTLAKLRAGDPVKIVAWGDSVTECTYLADGKDKWQEQFARWLAGVYPRAAIEWVSVGWGGRTAKAFLAEPPGSPHNFAEKVLGEKPDLVISEFVNDADVKGIVDETYAKAVLPAFRENGVEWIAMTPHYVRPDWMGLESQKNCDDDPRPFVRDLRAFAAREGIGLADAALLWGGLWRRGIPYLTLETNDINHPDAFGLSLYVEALKPLFAP